MPPGSNAVPTSSFMAMLIASLVLESLAPGVSRAADQVPRTVAFLPDVDEGSWSAVDLGAPLPQENLAWSAYDTNRNRMWIGTWTHESPYERVFAFELGVASSWQEIIPGGPSRRKLWRASAIYDPVRDRVVLFGGIGIPADGTGSTNELWFLWLGGDPFWQRATPSHPIPAGRHHHAAVYDTKRDRMIVVSGYGYVEYYGDYCPPVCFKRIVWPDGTWAFSMADSVWTRLGTDFELYGHSAVYDERRDRVLVFGGWHLDVSGLIKNPDVLESFSTVWQLPLAEGGSWSIVGVAGGPPPPRARATVVYDGRHDRMVVFGGHEASSSRGVSLYLDDVWALDLATAADWRPMFPTSQSPGARSETGALFEPEASRMWVFGGELYGNSFHDCWTLTWDAPTPVRISVESAEVVAMIPRIAWRVETGEPFVATVYRTDDDVAWIEVARPTPDTRGRLLFEDYEASPGQTRGYRLGIRERGVETFSETSWLEIRADPAFALNAITPNPIRDRLTVNLTLPLNSRARIDVHDVQGRLVVTRDLSGLSPGEHRVNLATRSIMPPGMYLVRATCGEKVQHRRAIVLR